MEWEIYEFAGVIALLNMLGPRLESVAADYLSLLCRHG